MKRLVVLAFVLLLVAMAPLVPAMAANILPRTVEDILGITIHEPPKGFNPLTASDEELAFYNYPPRPNDPDPARQEELMGQWESVVSGEWVRPVFEMPGPSRVGGYEYEILPSVCDGPIIQEMIGTISRIEDGYAYLSAVEYRLPHESDPRPDPWFAVPDGQWVSPTHWQSNDGSLDLFVGQEVSYYPESGSVSAAWSATHVDEGVVLSIDGDMIVVDVQEHVNEAGSVIEPELLGRMTFRIASSTHVGGESDEVKPGDRIAFFWFGDEGDRIVKQISVRSW